MSFSYAFRDISKAIRKWNIVKYMAFSDIKARYKRSVLGPLWLTLGTAVGSVGLGFLWSELLKVDFRSFVPSLTAGLILWQLISGLVIESTSLFGRQAPIIRNVPLPISIHPMQLLCRHFFNFLHNLPVFVLLVIVLGLGFGTSNLLVIPGVIILFLNLFWMSIILSILGARFRDLEYIVAMVMPLLMFISPVFYRPNYLPFSQNLIWLNPLSHLIEVVRDPLLGHIPPVFVYQVNCLMIIFGSALALWLLGKKKDRIAFWV